MRLTCADDMKISSQPGTRRPSKHADLSTLFGAFFILIVIPACFTAVTPRTTVELRREASGVSVEACMHTLLFIPYYCQREQGVTKVELEVHEGERVGYNSQLSKEENQLHRRGKTAPNAIIYFVGTGAGADVMIDVGDMDEVQAQAQIFIDSKQDATQSFTFYAHNAGFYVGGFMTLLSLLFPPLMGLAIIRRLLDRPYWPFDGF
jgi:hypothetical protein